MPFHCRLLSALQNDWRVLGTNETYFLSELIHSEAFTSLWLLGVPHSQGTHPGLACQCLQGIRTRTSARSPVPRREEACLPGGSPSPRSLCSNHRVPIWEAGLGAVRGGPEAGMDPPARAGKGGQGWERSGLRKVGVKIRSAGVRERGLCARQEGKQATWGAVQQCGVVAHVSGMLTGCWLMLLLAGSWPWLGPECPFPGRNEDNNNNIEIYKYPSHP